MGCEQGLFRSACPFPASLLLVVIVLLINPGLGDRSEEEKRSKKLGVEKASIASGKVSMQQGEDDTNTSTVKMEEPDKAAEDFLNTMAYLTAKQGQLKTDQRDIRAKLDTEKRQKDEVEKKLRNVREDLETTRERKEVCANRIGKARKKLQGVSETYEVLIARADQAITCLRGFCKEAEKTFVYQIPMTAGGKENFEKLKQETDINAVNQDLTLPPPDVPGGTTKADGSIKDGTGFFKDINLATTQEGPTENVATTDGKESKTTEGKTFDDIKLSTTDKSPAENVATTGGTEGTTKGVDDNFFNKEAINLCEEGALDGNWSHGSATENYKGRSEMITGTNVVFADGHKEKYSCIFDASKGTKLTLNMTAEGNRSKFEGIVSNNGKLIEWNDFDYWHKENTAEVKQDGSSFFNEGSIDQYKQNVNGAVSS